MGFDRVSTTDFMAPIQHLIPQVESLMRAQAAGAHPELRAALNLLLSSGGKRVRPAVALLSGGMLRGEEDRLITLAAAIELLHTATLVHDDLIDGALLRRGIATLNAQWTPAATVLTGDYVFARAAMLAADTDSVGVMHLFAETLATIVNGELTQLFSSRGLASRENYFNRIYAKTASMFELATEAAAMLSPVDRRTQKKMRSFGYHIGIAFQIMDDVLDLTGEQTTVGKPVASDLRQGLFTLPVLNFMLTDPDNSELKAIIEGKRVSDERMDVLVDLIRESGGIESAVEEARGYVDSALDILEDMPEGNERQSLAELAGYFVSRNI